MEHHCFQEKVKELQEIGPGQSGQTVFNLVANDDLVLTLGKHNNFLFKAISISLKTQMLLILCWVTLYSLL